MNRTLDTVRALLGRLNPRPVQVVVKMACHGGGLCEEERVFLVFEVRGSLPLYGERLLSIVRRLEAEGLRVETIGQAAAGIVLRTEEVASDRCAWLFQPSIEVTTLLKETP